ncbi:hypothetical protein FQR65_LT19137 [Abscondita terminalis]|nr:hypothetical protein FQR65_LT19137 [Abscondita terminalis]
MRVCSLHFSKDSFMCQVNVPAKIPRLKKNAVPSLNLPKKSIETMKPTSRRRNFNKENQDQISIDLCNKNVTANNIPTPQCRTIDNLHENEKLAISSMLDLVNGIPEGLPGKPRTREYGVLVKSGDLLVPFISAIDSDQKLNSLTGLNSF